MFTILFNNKNTTLPFVYVCFLLGRPCLIVVLPLETSACVQAGLDGDGGGSNNGHEGEGAVHHGSGVSLVFKGTVGVCWGDAVL